MPTEAEVLARLPDAVRAIVEGLIKITYWRGFVDGCVAALLAALAVILVILVLRRTL